MRLRVFFLLGILILFQSCQFFSRGTTTDTKGFDELIDFSSVDVSPSFAVCDSLINKEEKTACFRTTIHEHLFKSLSSQKISVHQPIEEVIQVHIAIDNKGKATLKSITATDHLRKAIPVIDSLINVSLMSLPTLFPAIKRGIPVATNYQLPIEISVK